MSGNTGISGLSSRWGRPPRILVAEDCELNRQITTAILAALGCEFSVASNGRDAVTLWRRGSYDVILMDCQMPEWDGWQATRAIREWEKKLHGTAQEARPAVIVALTGDGGDAASHECIRAGMNDLMCKPFGPSQLEEVLVRWLGQSPMPTQHLAGAMAAQRFGETATSPKTLAPTCLDRIRSIQRPGRGDLVGTVIAHFASDSAVLIERLRDAVHSADMKSVRQLSHTLRSSSANIGAERLSELCRRLEQPAVRLSSEEQSSIVAAIEEEVGRVLQALEKAQ